MIVKLTKVGEPFKNSAKGTKCVRCTFECIDNSQNKGKLFSMVISKDFDFINKKTNEIRKNIAHYVIKNNLKIGQVFSGVKEVETDYVGKVWLDHFTKDVVAII